MIPRRGVIEERNYLCLPSLGERKIKKLMTISLSSKIPCLKIIMLFIDMKMPAPLPLLSLVLKVARLEGEIYVHCANGHGRSALGY